jgi:hypothetical protein
MGIPSNNAARVPTARKARKGFILAHVIRMTRHAIQETRITTVIGEAVNESLA